MAGGEAGARGPGRSCWEARELLWPQDSPRPYSAGEDAARRHLDACPACQEFFRRDRLVSRRIREHGLAAKAPQELRERVYDALARERALLPPPPPDGSRMWPASGRGLAVAAGILLLAVALNDIWLAASRASATDVYVQDYVSRAMEEEVMESPDPSAISHFFLKEMGRSLPPVTPGEGKLSRAMICLIRGRRAAMVEYEVDGRTVAHYRLPLLRPGTPPEGRITRASGIRLATERGVRVARWEDGAFEHALVSELPAERLLALARNEFGAR